MACSWWMSWVAASEQQLVREAVVEDGLPPSSLWVEVSEALFPDEEGDAWK